MKIGIITDRIDQDSNQKTGISNYTRDLILNISNLDHENTIYLIHYEKNSDPLYQNMNEIIASLYNGPSTRFLQTSLTNTVKLPPLLKNKNIDIIHSPLPSPFLNSFFLLQDFKKVLTVHDLYMFFPQFRTKIYPHPKGWAHDQLWKRTLHAIRSKVDKYIAVSESTKKDIVKFLKIPEDRVKVIYEAPHERFKQMKLEIPEFIGSPFILSDTVESFHTTRLDIIEMYYRLRKRGIETKLVIFGGGNELHKIKLEKMIRDLNLQSDIIFTGHVSNNDLLKLYNAAELYIRPSLYEGFGLPPLEAMACGCPVAVSNVASLPEVVADAGMLVDPHNINDWVDGIYNILTNDGLREDFINKGLKRSKMFSWEKTAKETMKVYESVYNL